MGLHYYDSFIYYRIILNFILQALLLYHGYLLATTVHRDIIAAFTMAFGLLGIRHIFGRHWGNHTYRLLLTDQQVIFGYSYVRRLGHIFRHEANSAWLGVLAVADSP